MGILSKIIGRDDTILDVLDLLTTQHEEVDALIEQLAAGGDSRSAVFTELANKLAAHATIEEKIFYPYVMSKVTGEMLQEAVEEHLAMKRLLADMLTMQLDNAGFQAKLSVLQEQVAHHAHEEEEKKLFPKVKDLLSREERAGLANECVAMFTELLAGNASSNLPNETERAAELPNRR